MNKLTVCILTFLLLNPPALMATSKTSPDLEQLLPILHKEWQLEEERFQECGKTSAQDVEEVRC